MNPHTIAVCSRETKGRLRIMLFWLARALNPDISLWGNPSQASWPCPRLIAPIMRRKVTEAR